MNAPAAHWDILKQDLRYTARTLGRARGFALTASLSMPKPYQPAMRIDAFLQGLPAQRHLHSSRQPAKRSSQSTVLAITQHTMAAIVDRS